MGEARKNTFGGKLRKLRIEQGLTQAALGKGICTYAYISQLEAGTRRGSSVLVQRLAYRLGVNVSELIGPDALCTKCGCPVDQSGDNECYACQLERQAAQWRKRIRA